MGSMLKIKKASENIAWERLASMVSQYNLTHTAFVELVEALRGSYLSNFPFALQVHGVHTLHLHYEMLLQVVGGVPIGVVCGDMQTGKTTTMPCRCWEHRHPLLEEMLRCSVFFFR